MSSSPLVRSMERHLGDAEAFSDSASRARSTAEANRYVNAGLYELRGALDNLRTAAKHGTLRVGLKKLDRWIDHHLPRARLVRRLRNLHFHEDALGGPPRIRLEFRAQVSPHSRSSIAMFNDHRRPKLDARGFVAGTVAFFLVSGWLVQDEREREPVFIPSLLREEVLRLRFHLPIVSTFVR